MTTAYRQSVLWLLGTAWLMLLFGSAGAQQAGSTTGASEPVVAMIPQDLQWTTSPSLPQGAAMAVVHGNPKGEKPLTIRLKFPANYQVPPHTHPVTEHVTVLSGSLHVGLGENLDKSKADTLPAGGFVRVLAGVPHYAWTTEETIIQLHSNKGPWALTYVNPQDDPRAKAS